MKTRYSLFALVAVVLLGLAIPSTFAKPPKAKPAETHLTVIGSVTPTTITVNEDKMVKTFNITPFTEITVSGQRASVADLKPGMSVSVTIGSDPTKLSRVDAGAAPVQSGPPAKSR